MKENEVPEKIYIRSEAIFKALNKRRKESDIEYIRTDTFIEKAYNFLVPYIHDSRGDGSDRDYIYEIFKKYMKGE